MTQRLFYLDNLKGLLIILVVMGHVIQYSVADYQHNEMFRFIYSFHMPLFFTISGFLTYKENFDDRLLRRRAMQLLVPFVAWAIINSLWNGSAFTKALLYPDNGLWFLYNLFVYSVVFNLSVKWHDGRWRQEFSAIGIFVVSIVLMVLFGTLFNCTQLCWYMPFFAIGYYLRKYFAFVVRHGHVITAWGGNVHDLHAVLDDA